MGKFTTRVTDLYTNPLMQGGSAPIACAGSTSLIVGKFPVIQMTDAIAPIPDVAVPGATTVMHNSIPLNGFGDSTSTGGSLLGGDATVLIG
ncbi:MAG: hypothetical protein MK066_13985 [Crocinitomicaceae bacterium]|nr:hypothetical protein [Crocinitomicaceae bacterium]